MWKNNSKSEWDIYRISKYSNPKAPALFDFFYEKIKIISLSMINRNNTSKKDQQQLVFSNALKDKN